MKRQWHEVQLTVLDERDRYVVVPDISLDDYVQVKVEKEDKTWKSEWGVSNKRHLLFTEQD